MNAKERVTIKDVAHMAAVSPTTISRFLNHHISLPPDTAARIKHAVDKLGYRPNQLARNLSRGQSGMIGLVTPDIANPFFAQLASAAAEEASAHGFHILLCSTQNDPQKELAYLQLLDTRQLDGLVVLTSCAANETLGGYVSARSQVVLIDEDANVPGVPKVFVENQGGGHLATQYLIAHGHQRIAHIGGPKFIFSAKERFAGYAAALTEHNLPLDSSLTLFGLYTDAFGQEAANHLLDLPEPPTAIFAASDYVALGVLRALQKRGLSVPRDLSLVGFDDIALASLLQPALTTIRQPIDQLGQEGVKLLVSMLSADSKPKPQVQRLPVTLVERDSVRALLA